MVMYATPEQLAGYLQKDLDTYSATQALTLASAEFSAAADVWFAPQAVTYTTTGTPAGSIWLPYRPVTAVSEVRINGVAVTGWTLIGQQLYRSAGFGSSSTPDLLEVDLTHGYAAVPGDVEGAVLKMAARSYEHPTPGVSMEQIDDYMIRYDGKPVMVNDDPGTVISRYRLLAVA